MSSSTANRRLEGKVAIVTGGASGIGASTVHLFWQHGAKVVIADIQDNLGQALADNLGNGNICYIHCDVSNEDQVRNLVDATIAKFHHLDIFYSNAGIIKNNSRGILNVEKHELDRILSINLVGAFLVAKHSARVMVPNKRGCIMFTASACTKIAGIADSTYTSSKYGIVGLSKSLAAELGMHGIRVNCISPFGVLTGANGDDEAKKVAFEMVMDKVSNLKGRILKVEDVAKAALYLASDEACYVSGINLVVDGGYSVVNPTLLKFTMV